MKRPGKLTDRLPKRATVKDLKALEEKLKPEPPRLREPTLSLGFVNRSHLEVWQTQAALMQAGDFLDAAPLLKLTALIDELVTLRDGLTLVDGKILTIDRATRTPEEVEQARQQAAQAMRKAIWTLLLPTQEEARESSPEAPADQ